MQGHDDRLQQSATEASADDASQEVERVLSRVELSIRYHNLRRGFFDSAHSLTTALNVIAGTAVIVTALTSAPSWLRVAFAATVAVASVLNLVFRAAEKARVHHDLERRFRAVRKKLETATSPASALSESVAVVHDIESDELPVKHYVVALAHNAIAQKIDAPQEHFVKLGFVRRAVAHFTNIGSSSLPTFGQLAEQRRR